MNFGKDQLQRDMMELYVGYLENNIPHLEHR